VTSESPPPPIIPEAVSPIAHRAPRPRISPWQARRIDRLSRRAHRFHRFAHHPLCTRYAGEVIRIGPRVRLCRGCVLTALGGALGGAIAIVTPVSTPTIPLLAAAAALVVLVPSLASRRRFPKLVSRFTPSALFGFSLVASLVAAHFVTAAAILAVVLALRILYGRRGGDRSPCATCPERDDAPCSGFAPIIRREQAFQRTLRRLIVID
jgi:hypothetical protein